MVVTPRGELVAVNIAVSAKCQARRGEARRQNRLNEADSRSKSRPTKAILSGSLSEPLVAIKVPVTPVAPVNAFIASTTIEVDCEENVNKNAIVVGDTVTGDPAPLAPRLDRLTGELNTQLGAAVFVGRPPLKGPLSECEIQFVVRCRSPLSHTHCGLLKLINHSSSFADTDRGNTSTIADRPLPLDGNLR
ncbi:hypothetical protein J6590_054772 [Homalodisca vitripennis]|nr:hypothetical protein J6590_054772 [Homalodisca vitripennis]